MIKLKLESSWDEMIERLLEAEPQLTVDDIDFMEGEDEALVKKLAQKLNRSHEQITGWIESVSYTAAKAS